MLQYGEGTAKSELGKRLLAHVEHLSNEIGDRSVAQYQKLQQAADYIAAELSSYGYQVERQTYTVNGDTEVSNIIATKQGSAEQDEEVIILGAHYDTACNPGADDNASAVAGMLEIARLLTNIPLQHTIQFVAFVNEEPPYFHSALMGSSVFAAKARQQGMKIKLAIVLEMIGYYSERAYLHEDEVPLILREAFGYKGDFIVAVADTAGAPLVQEIAGYFNEHSAVPMKTNSGFESYIEQMGGLVYSDNWSFLEQGYPAVMITDTAFIRNPRYHQLTDTYDTLDYESMAEVVKGLTQAICMVNKTV